MHSQNTQERPPHAEVAFLKRQAALAWAGWQNALIEDDLEAAEAARGRWMDLTARLAPAAAKLRELEDST